MTIIDPLAVTLSAWWQTLTGVEVALAVVVAIWVAYLIAAHVIESRDVERRAERPIVDLLEAMEALSEYSDYPTAKSSSRKVH